MLLKTIHSLEGFFFFNILPQHNHDPQHIFEHTFEVEGKCKVLNLFYKSKSEKGQWFVELPLLWLLSIHLSIVHAAYLLMITNGAAGLESGKAQCGQFTRGQSTYHTCFGLWEEARIAEDNLQMHK